MQFNSVNLCISYQDNSLDCLQMRDFRAAKRESEGVLWFKYTFTAFVNIFPASWYHIIGKVIKGGKKHMIVISPIVIKVLRSLAPGGWINFSGTILQWTTTCAYMYISIWMNIQVYEHISTYAIQRNITKGWWQTHLHLHDRQFPFFLHALLVSISSYP